MGWSYQKEIISGNTNIDNTLNNNLHKYHSNTIPPYLQDTLLLLPLNKIFRNHLKCFPYCPLIDKYNRHTCEACLNCEDADKNDVVNTPFRNFTL